MSVCHKLKVLQEWQNGLSCFFGTEATLVLSYTQLKANLVISKREGTSLVSFEMYRFSTTGKIYRQFCESCTMVFQNCDLTDRQTCCSQYFTPYQGQSNNCLTAFCPGQLWRAATGKKIHPLSSYHHLFYVSKHLLCSVTKSDAFSNNLCPEFSLVCIQIVQLPFHIPCGIH